MCDFARRLLRCSAAPAACALATLCASPAAAQSDRKLDSFEFSGDVRAVAVDGERSWVEGGFGKLRSGSDGDLRVQPQLGNVSLVWKPQLTWSLGATIVGAVEGGQRTQAGLRQAFLSFRPMRSSKLAFSFRAGLMWPPVSLEHEGADWHVMDSITPSAINSWMGEEVRPLAAEASLATTIGDHKLRATAAVMTANDTAGTLLAFRGWALHDRTTLAFNRQPLSPLEDRAELQAPYTHPLLDVHRGFARHLGYYAKLAWQPPVPVRVELFRYDNRADPEDVTSGLPEWGWRTRFNNVGLIANLGGGTEIKAQALQGTTRMGFPTPVRRWIDERFRSAYVMLSKQAGNMTFSARGDAFDTRHRGSLWDDEYDERGWAGMLAVKRDWAHVTGLVELLHVWSKVPAREEVNKPERQPQTQLQAEVRIHW